MIIRIYLKVKVLCFSYRKSRGLFKRGDADDKEHHEKLKYSGAKLYEKGIVLEIEGLPTNQ